MSTLQAIYAAIRDKKPENDIIQLIKDTAVLSAPYATRRTRKVKIDLYLYTISSELPAVAAYIQEQAWFDQETVLREHAAYAHCLKRIAESQGDQAARLLYEHGLLPSGNAHRRIFVSACMYGNQPILNRLLTSPLFLDPGFWCREEDYYALWYGLAYLTNKPELAGYQQAVQRLVDQHPITDKTLNMGIQTAIYYGLFNPRSILTIKAEAERTWMPLITDVIPNPRFGETHASLLVYAEKCDAKEWTDFILRHAPGLTQETMLQAIREINGDEKNRIGKYLPYAPFHDPSGIILQKIQGDDSLENEGLANTAYYFSLTRFYGCSSTHNLLEKFPNILFDALPGLSLTVFKEMWHGLMFHPMREQSLQLIAKLNDEHHPISIYLTSRSLPPIASLTAHTATFYGSTGMPLLPSPPSEHPAAESSHSSTANAPVPSYSCGTS